MKQRIRVLFSTLGKQWRISTENKYIKLDSEYCIFYIENALRILFFSKSKFAVKSGKSEKDDNFYG